MSAMNNKINDPGAAAWDKVASKYESQATFVTGPAARWALEATLQKLALDGPVAIADIACGSGVLALAAAQRPERVSSVLASDYSAEFCALVEAKAKALEGAAAPVRTLVSDAQDLSGIPSDSVDAVFCSFALMMIPNPEKAAREFKRIVKPGGLICITTWCPPEQSQFHAFMLAMSKYVASKQGAPCSHGGPATTTCAPAPAPINFQLPFNSPEQLRNLFETIAVQTELVEKRTDVSRVYNGAADFCDSMANISPFGLFSNPSAETAAFMKEFVASVFGAESPFILSFTSLVAIARKPSP